MYKISLHNNPVGKGVSLSSSPPLRRLGHMLHALVVSPRWSRSIEPLSLSRGRQRRPELTLFPFRIQSLPSCLALVLTPCRSLGQRGGEGLVHKQTLVEAFMSKTHIKSVATRREDPSQNKSSCSMLRWICYCIFPISSSENDV